VWPRQAQRGPTALLRPGVGPLRGLLDRAFSPADCDDPLRREVQDRADPVGDLDHVLLQGSDAGGGLPMAIRSTARQGRDAPEVEPHTPPHAAQTGSRGTDPPERGQSPTLGAGGPTTGQWPIWPGPAVLASARRFAVTRTAVCFLRSRGRVCSGQRRSRCSITLALRFWLAHSGPPWFQGAQHGSALASQSTEGTCAKQVRVHAVNNSALFRGLTSLRWHDAIGSN
jgi:hypothetical protein